MTSMFGLVPISTKVLFWHVTGRQLAVVPRRVIVDARRFGWSLSGDRSRRTEDNQGAENSNQIHAQTCIVSWNR